MKYLLFIIIYSILWCISVLPFSILYFISDFLYIILYKLVGYRVRTVRANLKLAFPQLNDKERREIEKKFYHHLCDLFMEMVKTLSISEKELNRRFTFSNIELLKEYERKDKSIILMLPHYANWEWVISLGSHIEYKGFGVYKKLSNKYFDKLMRDIRSKFNAELISTRETTNVIRTNQSKGLHGVYLFLSDQTPLLRANLHWEEFMGVEVPVHMGAEALARKLDMNILYLRIDKKERGYYAGSFSEITDNIKMEPKYRPTRMFLDKVEEQVREVPYYYFWTHKRWKYQGRKEEVI